MAIRALAVAVAGLALAAGIGSRPAPGPASRAASQPAVRIFSGRPRLIVVNGYSTSFRWPKLLQAKLDRYFEGRRVIEVRRLVVRSSGVPSWIIS